MIWPVAQDAATVLLTVKVAAVAVLIDLPPALLLAALLARRRFPGRALLETLLNLPLVLPPVATGLALLMVLTPTSTTGGLLKDGLGLQFVFAWPGAALAAAVVSFPLMLRSLLLGFEAIDPRYVGMARTLGTGPVAVMARIHLPMALPAILAGSLLAFARALGEFGATVIVAGSIPGKTRTLPLDLFHRVQIGDRAGALRLTLISALLAFLILAVGRAAERRITARLES